MDAEPQKSPSFDKSSLQSKTVKTELGTDEAGDGEDGDDIGSPLANMLYDFLMEPGSSRKAFSWNLFCCALVIIRIIAIGCESCNGPNQYYHRDVNRAEYKFLLTLPQYYALYICCMTPLLFDSFARIVVMTLITVEQENISLYRRFMSDKMELLLFIFDMGSNIRFMIWISYVQLNQPTFTQPMNITLRILELLAISRIYRGIRRVRAIRAVTIGLTNSIPHLILPLFFFCIFNISAGVFFYFAEPCYNVDTCPWQSLFQSTFYAVVTMTTTGYGNQVPSYEFARFIACCVMVFGALFLSMPLAIIGNEYDTAWNGLLDEAKEIQEQLQAQEAAQNQEAGGGGVDGNGESTEKQPEEKQVVTAANTPSKSPFPRPSHLLIGGNNKIAPDPAPIVSSASVTKSDDGNSSHSGKKSKSNSRNNSLQNDHPLLTHASITSALVTAANNATSASYPTTAKPLTNEEKKEYVMKYSVMIIRTTIVEKLVHLHHDYKAYAEYVHYNILIGLCELKAWLPNMLLTLQESMLMVQLIASAKHHHTNQMNAVVATSTALISNNNNMVNTNTINGKGKTPRSSFTGGPPTVSPAPAGGRPPRRLSVFTKGGAIYRTAPNERPVLPQTMDALAFTPAPNRKNSSSNSSNAVTIAPRMVIPVQPAQLAVLSGYAIPPEQRKARKTVAERLEEIELKLHKMHTMDENDVDDDDSMIFSDDDEVDGEEEGGHHSGPIEYENTSSEEEGDSKKVDEQHTGPLRNTALSFVKEESEASEEDEGKKERKKHSKAKKNKKKKEEDSDDSSSDEEPKPNNAMADIENQLLVNRRQSKQSSSNALVAVPSIHSRPSQHKVLSPTASSGQKLNEVGSAEGIVGEDGKPILVRQTAKSRLSIYEHLVRTIGGQQEFQAPKTRRNRRSLHQSFVTRLQKVSEDPNNWQNRIWLLLEVPESSREATILQIIFIFLICMSVFVLYTQTVTTLTLYGESAPLCGDVVNLYCNNKNDPNLDPACFVQGPHNSLAYPLKKLRFGCDETDCYGYGVNFGSDNTNVTCDTSVAPYSYVGIFQNQSALTRTHGRPFLFTSRNQMHRVSAVCRRIECMDNSDVYVNANALWIVFEFVSNAIFSMEIVLRLLVTNSVRHYVSDYMNYIDWFAILPFYSDILNTLITTGTFSKINFSIISSSPIQMFLVTIRSFQVFRMFKLTRHFRASKVLFETAKRVWKQIFGMLASMAFMVTVFSIILYEMERGTTCYVGDGKCPVPDSLLPTAHVGDMFHLDKNGKLSPIPNVFYGVWYSFVTLTTTGYGDIVPSSSAGQVMGIFLMMAGIFYMAMPLTAAATTFYTVHEYYNSKHNDEENGVPRDAEGELGEDEKESDDESSSEGSSSGSSEEDEHGSDTTGEPQHHHHHHHHAHHNHSTPAAAPHGDVFEFNHQTPSTATSLVPHSAHHTHHHATTPAVIIEPKLLESITAHIATMRNYETLLQELIVQLNTAPLALFAPPKEVEEEEEGEEHAHEEEFPYELLKKVRKQVAKLCKEVEMNLRHSEGDIIELLYFYYRFLPHPATLSSVTTTNTST